MTCKKVFMLTAMLASVLSTAPVFADSPTSPVFEKPFLKSGGAQIGGYIDMEFIVDPTTSTFDQHRFVPFLYAEVSDRVHVASEIEFEHGGFVAAGEGDGEIKLEFATMDFRVSEALNLRGGVLLSPLGRLNVLHDAPMLDLTDRPLVTRNVIPTTLSESGMGFYGTLYPSELTVLDYEIYLVNGFGAETVDGNQLNVRAGRGSRKQDNNNSRSVVGRLGFSPRLGVDLGASGHVGAYDDEADETLSIFALDARVARGAFELVAEGAFARAGLPSAAPFAGDNTSNIDEAGASGFYAETRYHLLQGAISKLPQSVFTGVFRFDHVDLDTKTDGALRQRMTLGLNFRPTEESVFKNDLVFNRAQPGTAAGAPNADWSDFEVGYRFSMATYF